MRNIYAFLIFTLFASFSSSSSFSQTYTTSSKNCGKCGKAVSAYSKIGDTCPHCGVTWGRENTQTSTSTYSLPNYQSNITPNNSRGRLPVATKSKTSTRKRIVKDDEDVDNSTATKFETESWILEKLNSNTPKRYYETIGSLDGFYSSFTPSGWYKMNYNYSFDDFNLVIKYELENNKKVTRYIVKVPIYDVERAYDYKGNFWLTTKKETITTYNISDNTKSVGSSFSTDFNVYAETELCKRIHKAFLHLKKFYKKPTSTEPF